MDEIVEQIIDAMKGTPKMKESLLFDFIDAHLDGWKIDIPDEFYLDDIVASVSNKINKRENLFKRSKDDDFVVFKRDEEAEEKKQLKKVVKQYDSLYENACALKIVENSPVGSVCSSNNTPAGSWKDVLDRIDYMRSKK